MSEGGVPTLTKDGHTWADLKTTGNGVFLLSNHVVMPSMVVHDASAHRHLVLLGNNSLRVKYDTE